MGSGVSNERERVGLGLCLSRLSQTGGYTFGNIRLYGEDKPGEKSYYKVMQEIRRRQLAREPLW
jgi:hypothetical protein